MNLKETGCEGVDSSGGRIAGFCEHGDEVSDTVKRTSSFSTRTLLNGVSDIVW
jgi:hypothetical protein